MLRLRPLCAALASTLLLCACGQAAVPPAAADKSNAPAAGLPNVASSAAALPPGTLGAAALPTAINAAGADASLPFRPDPHARPVLPTAADSTSPAHKTLVNVGSKNAPQAAGTPETDALVKAADELRRQGDYQGALRKVREALQKVPQHPQGLLLAGTLEGATNQNDEAVRHLRQAIALMPDNLFARKVYATVLMQKHDPAGALETLGPVLQAKPLDSQAYTLAAQITAGGGDVDGARKYLDQVFAADAGYVPARELAVRIALSRHQPEEARAQLQAIIKAHPDDAAAMVGLAGLDASMGNMSEAGSLLEQARKAQPQQAEPLIASAELALRQGHAEEASGYVNRLQTLIPGSAAELSLKGQLALAQGHPKDAVEPLQGAFAKKPIPEILVQLHQALLGSGQPAEADKRMGDWLTAHPDDLRMRFYAAETAARRGDYASAATQYRKILDKDPDNLLALNDLAQSLQAQHDPKALETAEKAWKLKPDSPVTENTLGAILMTAGQSERGLGLLREAAGKAPQNPEVRFDYARALAVTGDKVKAKSELEALLALKHPFRSEGEARDMLKGLSGS